LLVLRGANDLRVAANAVRQQLGVGSLIGRCEFREGLWKDAIGLGLDNGGCLRRLRRRRNGGHLRGSCGERQQGESRGGGDQCALHERSSSSLVAGGMNGSTPGAAAEGGVAAETGLAGLGCEAGLAGLGWLTGVCGDADGASCSAGDPVTGTTNTPEVVAGASTTGIEPAGVGSTGISATGMVAPIWRRWRRLP